MTSAGPPGAATGTSSSASPSRSRASPARVYRETRKQHDLIFNLYVMRPFAALVVAAIAPSRVTPNQVTLANLFVFAVAAFALVAFPSWEGGIAAILILELSYCLDCVDGMLARFKGLASKTGHLFDFFTDELKAVLLVVALPVRAWRAGGLGIDGHPWAPGDPRFLLAGIAGVAIVASAVSLTTFLRRPEVSGRETSVEAHYDRPDAKPGAEPAARASGKGLTARAFGLVGTFLRFLNHYPSHIWLWAIAGRLEVYFWLWVFLNAVYLARGWLGIVLRFGRT